MRVYIQRRLGFRNVRGGHIIDLQKAIASSVAMPTSIDGIFGNQTETALKIWQNANGFEPHGKVDELTWSAVTQNRIPSLFRRCLAITAAFEGHGYTFAAGNWDDAYLTWGVVGFTLKHGNLGKVIGIVNSRYPGLIAQTIGAEKASELLDIINASTKIRKRWADDISLPPKKYRIRPDWEDAFKMLGHQSEVRQIQDEVARNVYWSRAMADLKRYGEATEADAALFFDIAVQNGGIDDKKSLLIEEAKQGNASAKSRDRLALIAEAIASGSNPAFSSDVLSRKKCIADGTGVVHGAKYHIQDWAIDYLDVPKVELESLD